MSRVIKKGFITLTPKQLEERIKQANQVSSLQLEGDIKIHTPVDTGLLRNSVQTVDIDSKGFVVGVPSFSGDTDLEYAFYQNYGTIYIEPKYFMERGAKDFNNSKVWVENVKRALK